MKKYKIIYADPPWRYARSKVQGAAEKHYPTMSIEELCALPVKEIADKDCILFLWATFPQLKEALQLIKAWGFTYKSVAFVWLKQNRKSPTWFYGLGFWTRGNAEICLLATKGHPKRQSNKVHQFIISPVEQHSKKPDITREKILALIKKNSGSPIATAAPKQSNCLLVRLNITLLLILVKSFGTVTYAISNLLSGKPYVAFDFISPYVPTRGMLPCKQFNTR